MYFLTALACTAIFVLLWQVVKTKKPYHFEYGALIFGAATAMWLIDCIASAVEGEGFLSFEMPTDYLIAIWTVVGGFVFYAAVVWIKYFVDKKKAK